MWVILTLVMCSTVVGSRRIGKIIFTIIIIVASIVIIAGDGNSGELPLRFFLNYANRR